MQQAIQQMPRTGVAETAKPSPATQATAGALPEKKSKWWIWLIILIVIIAVGAGAYYWFFMR